MVDSDVLDALRVAIVNGDSEETERACAAALAAKIEPAEIINEGMSRAMQIVGEKWNSHEYFLPDIMVSAEAMKAGMAFLAPHMRASAGGPAGTVVIGTVKGDIHSIGKNLVALFLEVAGFQVHNLGEDVPAERFVEAVVKYHADIVGSSAFVSSVAAEMARIEELLREAGVRDRVFTMVGGAVLDSAWGEKIGADAWGRDAVHAVELAKAFVGRRRAAGR